MKAIMKLKPEMGFELKEVEEPKLKESTDVKLKILKSSICGTDYHIYNYDDWTKENVKLPHLNGHEVLAEIVEVGSGVKQFHVGDVVACETHIFCGNCYQCRTGNSHVCSNMEILGVHRDGIWGEYQVVPQNILWKIEGIDHKYAGIMEPLGNAIHTLSYSDVAGKHVLISGAGPIGIMAAYVAKIRGAATVSITEINDYRIKMVEKMNLNIHIINPSKDNLKEKTQKITGKHGIDVIAEMTGNEKALQDMCELVVPAGEINILSIYPTKNITLPLNDLVFKNIKVQTITGRRLFSTWNTASEWLKFGLLDPKALDYVITHEFKMEDFEKAFEVMKKGECGKMILDFTYLNE